MQKQSCNLVLIEILGCHHRGEDQDISELDAKCGWDYTASVSLLKFTVELGERDHACSWGSGRIVQAVLGDRQLSSENQVHATRTKVGSKSTGGKLPNFTSEQRLHFYESRDNKFFPLVTQLFIGDSGQYLRPVGSYQGERAALGAELHS